MGCNRKVKLLVSQLFRGWEGGSKKVTFAAVPAGSRFMKLSVIAKHICLLQKRNFLILARLFLYYTMKTTEKSVKDQPRFFGAFVPVSDSGARFNREG